MAKTCSVCGRRQAVYYHRASGDYVCAQCLERRLARYVRKSFGKYRLVAEPRPSIAFLAHPLLMVESAAGARLLTLVEKGYTKSMVLLWPKATCERLLEKALNSARLPLNVVYYEPPEVGHESLCTVDRRVRASAVKALSTGGGRVRYLALPHPRDFSLALSIDGLMQGNTYCFMDGLPALGEPEGFKIIKPFHEILWEDLVAYAAINGFIEGFEDCYTVYSTPALTVVREASLPGGPELLYGFQTVLSLLEADAEHAGTCRLCGGYEHDEYLKLHGGLCRVCWQASRGRG